MLCCGRTLSRLVALRGSAPRQLCSSLSTAIIMAEQGIGPQSGGEYPASDMPASAAGSYDSMEGVAPGQHNQADQHEGERQSEQNAAGSVPEAKPTGALQDMDKNDLVAKRNQILWEQAVKGQQPGLTLMQDRLSGENKQETWGNEPSIVEPDEQN